VIAALSTLTHHGIIYVPLGYKTAFPILGNVSEVRGGSPWGAGTFAVSRKIISNKTLVNSPSRLQMGLVNQARLNLNLPPFMAKALLRL